MVNCKFFYNLLTRHGIDFFTGVPDTLLKDFCAYIVENAAGKKHIIAANEGGAIALACGHYLATGHPALVYMQNSGQGNAINPLVSLADQDVYSIPLLMLIGWRGEPGKKDEPQHLKQGKITLSLLDTLNIRYRVLSDTNKGAEKCIEKVFELLKETNAPVALIVKKGTFEGYELKEQNNYPLELTREEAIKLIVDRLGPSDVVISTTGKASRELYEYRDQLDDDHSRDFLTVGSMGHASQIALGIALRKPARQVFCLDGDGAAIMHMGAIAITGSQEASNFKHIIINNSAHESVGGQPTVGFKISLANIAKECGYQMTMHAETHEQVCEAMELLKSADGPALLEIRVRRGARADLGRPKTPPKENKIKFMEFLSR